MVFCCFPWAPAGFATLPALFYVVALWEAFYIENKRFDLDTLRVPNRSLTQASKINDFLGLFADIWGGPGPPFPHTHKNTNI